MTGVPGTGEPGRDRSARWIAGFRLAVLDWGERHRRDLPWRATRDPWRVLVSEVMLQQTQAARVVEPYRRFVERFPTPEACASAGSAAVVRAWSGLGYNRRAVNLHRASAAIVDRHGGRVPDDLTALRELPGVGEYTARAVLVFAHESDVGVVDTNVARLLARAVVGAPLGRAEAQELADRLVPMGRGWAFNQALFDLGARHCTARRPDCRECPLRRRCRWATAGSAAGSTGAPATGSTDDPVTAPPTGSTDDPVTAPATGSRGSPRVDDPALRTAGTSRPQARFEGSERQGRGRMVEALRSGPVAARDLPLVAGWKGEPGRSRLAAEALVSEGLARWLADGRLALA